MKKRKKIFIVSSIITAVIALGGLTYAIAANYVFALESTYGYKFSGVWVCKNQNKMQELNKLMFENIEIPLKINIANLTRTHVRDILKVENQLINKLIENSILYVVFNRINEESNNVLFINEVKSAYDKLDTESKSKFLSNYMFGIQKYTNNVLNKISESIKEVESYGRKSISEGKNLSDGRKQSNDKRFITSTDDKRTSERNARDTGRQYNIYDERSDNSENRTLRTNNDELSGRNSTGKIEFNDNAGTTSTNHAGTYKRNEYVDDNNYQQKSEEQSENKNELYGNSTNSQSSSDGSRRDSDYGNTVSTNLNSSYEYNLHKDIMFGVKEGSQLNGYAIDNRYAGDTD